MRNPHDLLRHPAAQGQHQLAHALAYYTTLPLEHAISLLEHAATLQLSAAPAGPARSSAPAQTPVPSVVDSTTVLDGDSIYSRRAADVLKHQPRSHAD